MRSSIRFAAAALAALYWGLGPAAAEQSTRKIEKTALCADPACKKGAAAYRPWELKLQVPAKLGQCTTYRTTPFFAVILTRNLPDTAELDCAAMPKSRQARAGERERLKAANAFVGPQTYFLRMLCTGQGANVEYSIEGETGMLKNFLAVYTGTIRSAAEGMVGVVKAKYPQAELVSMTARIENGDDRCK